MNRPILILDTETTGLDAKTGALVEVACARVDTETGKLIDARSMLVVRPDNVAHDGEAIHGIPSHLTARFGTARENAVTCLRRMAANSEAILAHNADFDRRWFGDELLGVPWACSMDIEWPRSSPGKSLTATALAHGVGVTRAHRAIDDVMTLASLLERAVELGANIETLIKRALRRKVRVVASLPRHRNPELKAAGFRWDPERTQWWKKCFVDEVAALPFDVREAP